MFESPIDDKLNDAEYMTSHWARGVFDYQETRPEIDIPPKEIKSDKNYQKDYYWLHRFTLRAARRFRYWKNKNRPLSQ